MNVEKLDFGFAAPEGAIHNMGRLTVCLKAYPDTNLEFFRILLRSGEETR
jgi:hypothetical protein